MSQICDTRPWPETDVPGLVRVLQDQYTIVDKDRDSHRATLDGVELVLTPRAAMLLDYLMARPGELHTHDQLLAALWGYTFPTTTRAVDQRVSELRKVLGESGVPRFIETVPGAGYRFCAAVSPG